MENLEREFPCIGDLEKGNVWYPWRGVVTEDPYSSYATSLPSPSSSSSSPHGGGGHRNWRSLPHLQSVDACRALMGPRAREADAILAANGVDPATVSCGVCQQGGGLAACFQDDIPAGSRHHLRKLWSLALAAGPDVTAKLRHQVQTPEGWLRFDFVRGTIELCRGDPPTNEPPPPMEILLEVEDNEDEARPDCGGGEAGAGKDNKDRDKATSSLAARRRQQLKELGRGRDRTVSGQAEDEEGGDGDGNQAGEEDALNRWGHSSPSSRKGSKKIVGRTSSSPSPGPAGRSQEGESVGIVRSRLSANQAGGGNAGNASGRRSGRTQVVPRSPSLPAQRNSPASAAAITMTASRSNGGGTRSGQGRMGGNIQLSRPQAVERGTTRRLRSGVGSGSAPRLAASSASPSPGDSFRELSSRTNGRSSSRRPMDSDTSPAPSATVGAIVVSSGKGDLSSDAFSDQLTLRRQHQDAPSTATTADSAGIPATGSDGTMDCQGSEHDFFEEFLLRDASPQKWNGGLTRSNGSGFGEAAPSTSTSTAAATTTATAVSTLKATAVAAVASFPPSGGSVAQASSSPGGGPKLVVPPSPTAIAGATALFARGGSPAAGSGAVAAAVQGSHGGLRRLHGSKSTTKVKKEVRWWTDVGIGLEAENDEREERVTLDGPRPLGLQIGPAEEGRRGAVIRHSEGQAAAAGVEPGSMILTINDEDVEDMDFPAIQGILDRENLPVTLDLRPPLDALRVNRRKPRRRDPVTVYTAGCRGSYRVVTEAIEHLGWLELRNTGDTMHRAPSVVWLEHADPTEGIAPVQTVSRLEAFLTFCKKARLAQSLNAWTEMLPETFAFSPQTWTIPYEATELKAAMIAARSEETFIVKPTAGAQGKGIMLAKKWKDVDHLVQKSKTSQENVNKATIEYVVQRYIAEPLLLDGLKFDMRMYVVVTSIVPLRAYIFKEGLARFCTVPYEQPTDTNLREAKMHLTNFAVNKKSKDFRPSEGLAAHNEGSKRSISGTLRQIEQAHGVSPDEIWAKVAALIANTLMALRPALLEYYVHEQPRQLHPLGPKGFQLIGLDVLLDQDVEPRLLELNANPSLSATQPAGDKMAAAAVAAAQAAEMLPGSDPNGPVLKIGEEAAQASSSATTSASASPTAEGPICATAASQGVDEAPQTQIQTQKATPAANVLALGGLQIGGSSSSSSLLIGNGSKVLGQAPFLRHTNSDALLKPSRNIGTPPLQLLRNSQNSGRGGPQDLLTSRPLLAAHGSSPNTTSDVAGPSSSVTSPPPSSGRKRGARHSRSGPAGEGGKKEREMVTSELDLQIKRELVVQALLLTRPAPQNKVARLKKKWNPRTTGEIVPLGDDGLWALPQKATKSEATRPDAPERCPALEEIDFEGLVAPDVFEYSAAHLNLYRWWVRACGNARDSLGQAQVQRMLEREGLVGDIAGALFQDRTALQLWLSQTWRNLAPGAFGLNLPQFVALAARLGQMLEGLDKPTNSEDEGPPPSGRLKDLMGVLAFTRRGLCRV